MANILICDEEATTVTMLQETFTRNGHTVTVVNDIVDAVRVAYPARFHACFIGVDLQQTDLVWHRLAGLQILRKCDPNLPVIVLGHGSSLELERQFRREGIFYYCLKPIDAAEIREVLRNALTAEGYSSDKNLAI